MTRLCYQMKGSELCICGRMIESVILTLLSCQAPILQTPELLHRAPATRPRAVLKQDSTKRCSHRHRQLATYCSGARIGRCAHGQRDRGRRRRAELAVKLRTVCRKPWPRRDEHGAGTTARTSTPTIIILVEVVRRGNPDRDEIDGMEWHLGADGDVQADSRLHGHTAAVGVLGVGAFSESFVALGLSPRPKAAALETDT